MQTHDVYTKAGIPCTETYAHEDAREFLAELSHNLQTPLAVLKARIERLQCSMVRDGEMRDDFCGIDDSIETLSRAIAEVLATAVCPQGPSINENKHKVLSFSELVADVAADAAVVAELQSIELITRITPHLSVRGDARALREAIMNLLSNAMKYMGSKAKKEIHVRLAQESDQITLTVTDTGIGVPPEDVPHIFNRFYRGTRVYGIASGIGLGLASVQRTVTAHGGSVAVSSVLGEGSTFTVNLPAASEHQ